MRQLLLPGALAAGQRVELSGDEHHYLVHVLRKCRGDRLVALDGSGARWVVELGEEASAGIVVHVIESVGGLPAGADGPHDPSSLPRFPSVTLYQAIPKGRKLDEVIRQLVQVGVTSIRPVVTARSVVRPDGGGNRIERWQRIAREAVQQSGASRPVDIAEPVELGSIASAPGALSLVLHTQPIAQTTLHGYLCSIPDEIELVVGPEGGLSGNEMEELGSRGFLPLWLGPQVLRAETAGVFAAAAIRVLILERGSWQPVRM